MVLRYCRRHERRWSVTRQRWRPFPAAPLQAIHASAARLRATDPEAPALTVRDPGCDGCAATPWPLPSPSARPMGCIGERHEGATTYLPATPATDTARGASADKMPQVRDSARCPLSESGLRRPWQ